MSATVHNHGAFGPSSGVLVAYDRGSNKVAPNQRELTGAYDHPTVEGEVIA